MAYGNGNSRKKWLRRAIPLGTAVQGHIRQASARRVVTYHASMNLKQRCNGAERPEI
jgi:nucleoid DNA-binding protein